MKPYTFDWAQCYDAKSQSVYYHNTYASASTTPSWDVGFHMHMLGTPLSPFSLQCDQ